MENQDLLSETPTTIKGLLVDVYPNPWTKSEIGGKYKQALLVGPGVPSLSGPSSKYPVLILKRLFDGTKAAVPMGLAGKFPILRFGGSFIWLSHRKFPEKAPIMIFDALKGL